MLKILKNTFFKEDKFVKENRESIKKYSRVFYVPK
jgi:hypothetical protein